MLHQPLLDVMPMESWERESCRSSSALVKNAAPPVGHTLRARLTNTANALHSADELTVHHLVITIHVISLNTLQHLLPRLPGSLRPSATL